MTFVPQTPDDLRSTRPTPVTEQAAHSKRTLGEDAVPAPSHSSQHVPHDFREINGWGADLDPANRPAVPRELPSAVRTVRGNVKHWQQPRTRVQKSNEHPDLTPVFGDTCAPHGLSGMMRDYAYQFGEAANRHWITLMAADRVDVVESMFRDAFGGRDEKARRTVMIVGAAVAAAGIGLIASRALRSRKRG